VRQEVVEVDEEDRRVAAGRRTDADDLDPDDLAPEDRPAGHGDRTGPVRDLPDTEVERLLGQRFAGVAADDIELPPTQGGPR
jgi:multicomponent Na+:H+ antiporter subunit C